MILPAKLKRARTSHDSLELETDEDEWEEDEFSHLDTANEDADSDDVDVEDWCWCWRQRHRREASFCMVKPFTPLFRKVRLLVIAGIYETKNKIFYIGCLLKRFLKDEEGDRVERVNWDGVFEAKSW